MLSEVLDKRPQFNSPVVFKKKKAQNPTPDSAPDIIKERFSPAFNRVFTWYTLLLFRRRFGSVWLNNQEILPEVTLDYDELLEVAHGNENLVTDIPLLDYSDWNRSILFVGTHHSWWDGLIPLLLNELVFNMQGRAIMDEEQLKNYPFFRRIGTFGINRKHPRKAIQSLNYAAQMLNDAPKNKRVGLWFYPQGKIVSSEDPVRIESGISFLAKQLKPKQAMIVPFSTYSHTMFRDRPELFIRFGAPISPGLLTSPSLVDALQQILDHLYRSVKQEGTHFKNLIPSCGTYTLLFGTYPPGEDSKEYNKNIKKNNDLLGRSKKKSGW